MTNNPFQYNQQRWKFLLLIFAVLIAVASLVYTNYLTRNLTQSERTKAEVWAMSTRTMMTMPDINDEFISYVYAVRDSLVLPAIITDSRDSIIHWRNLDPVKTNIALEAESATSGNLEYDPAYFQRQLTIMKKSHVPIPIELFDGEQWLVYYKDSEMLTRLRIFPYLQLTLIGIFLAVAYTVFNSIRKSEQNLVWVGLAKEAAHQLGTPISSLMAWLELVRTKYVAEDDGLLNEMENDIKRLETVADRFSKIGSEPALEKTDVVGLTKSSYEYLKSRFSNNIEFSISLPDYPIYLMLNPILHSWTIENLIKNSIDAMKGKGKIHVSIEDEPRFVKIKVEDNGKGIPKNEFKRIFDPGFTTKKRGWGLGLSLTKRIVEEYHSGNIKVLHSESGKGTTMQISWEQEK